MKMILAVAFALVAFAVAAPPPLAKENEYPKILRSEQTKDENGYTYGFDTENGINREEIGQVKELKDEDGKPIKVVTIQGSYKYIDNDGNEETITYYADETGFHAEGPSIPKQISSRK